MSSTMKIPAFEHGVQRLFGVDLPEDDIPAFYSQFDVDDTNPWPVAAALGVETLDEDYVEMFDVAHLEGLGLPQYLIEGSGIPEDQVAPLHGQLTDLTGHVAMISSGAFQGEAVTLTPKAPLRHIATFFDNAPPVTFEDLPDESAKRTTPEDMPLRKKPSDAAIGGRVAVVALLVAFGVAGMMVWIAG